MCTVCINSGSLQQFIMSWAIRNVRLPCKWTKRIIQCPGATKMGKLYFFCQWAAVINGHQCAAGVKRKPPCVQPWNSCNLLSRIENGMAIHVKWHNDYRKRAACTDHNLSISRILFAFIKDLNFKFRKYKNCSETTTPE